jgi:Xaa-Pro aminopeptidase
MTTALLFIDNSDHNSDLYYKTGFLAGDAFLFTVIGDEKILLMSDLEAGRAKRESRADTVLMSRDYSARAKAGGVERPGFVHIIHEFYKERGIKTIKVPGSFGLQYADPLRALGYVIEVSPEPVFPERVIKRPEEVAHIEEAQRVTEVAVQKAFDILRDSTIVGDGVQFEGKPLTVEFLKREMNRVFFMEDHACPEMIVAPFPQSCDPHNRGSGLIPANQPIVFDIFPRDMKTRFWADMSRTVLKGKASDKVKKLWDAVHESQTAGLAALKPGARGDEVHATCQKVFDKLGYKTEMIDGNLEGFIHGTGHGVGLDIHELPSVGRVPSVLEEGAVVTVEPGLYYRGIGGVRLEDMALITKGGSRNLTKFPKYLEIK